MAKRRGGCLLYLLIAVGLLVFCGVLLALATGPDSKNDKSTTTAVPVRSNAQVTLVEFNQIQNGMNYQQVKNIFGGTEFSSSSATVAEQTIDTLTWHGDGIGDVVIVQFDGPKDTGHVISKSQSGLG